MTPRQFYDHVVTMRQKQKEYFKSRSSVALQEAKNEERIIDAEIDRVTKILIKQKCKPLNLE